ncbi:hypothetical protein ACVCII_04150 [Burkholderia glumae]|uniref:hypothetical protein n=1 Tax=Burkholderia glumae TaxID=337 RepID=UPI00203760B0|nr:hypothetical protein [Burkholderia glumae]MCM2546172.1 hypothetical protein [Burkholderia glumae]
MNLDSLIFDLEMAHRRLPEVPSDDEFMGDNELDEWRAVRSHLPALIQLAKEAKHGKEASQDR